jgi:uncharacterized membrane protein
LSGLLAGNASTKATTRPFGHYAKRGLSLVAVAVVLDVCCWSVTPFYHFDVLYLLALLQLVAAKFSQLRGKTRGLLVIALLVATEPLQDVIAYRSECSHWAFDVLQSWLVDGWFPVFPWLGLGLAGSHLGASGLDCQLPAVRRRLSRLAAALVGLGAALGYHQAPLLMTRGGYAELFYPPTLGFSLVALGMLLGAQASLSALRRAPLVRVFALLGRYSLLLYIVHVAVIARVIRPLLEPRGSGHYVVIYLALTLALLGLAATVSRFWPRPRWFFAKMLLG